MILDEFDNRRMERAFFLLTFIIYKNDVAVVLEAIFTEINQLENSVGSFIQPMAKLNN